MSRKLFARLFLGLIALYFVMFAARAVYDLITYEETDITTSYNVYYDYEDGKGSRSGYQNIATYQTTIAGAGNTSPTAVIDQKYERVATVATKTVSYDADMQNFQASLAENEAVIQSENRRDLIGQRKGEFIIGVHPDRFDLLHEALSQIGHPVTNTVTKTDKTYEYQQMLSRKEALERRLESYQEMKENTSSVNDLLKLEEHIVEVENDIRYLMLELGEFSDDQALCTINFTLSEGSEAPVSRKLWNALGWTTSTYCMIILIILLVAFAAFVVCAVWAFLKRVLVDKPEAKQPPQAPVQVPYGPYSAAPPMQAPAPQEKPEDPQNP